MAKKLHLTLACGDYEIMRPLIEGTVEPDGIELTVLTNMNAEVRHRRMLSGRKFDVAEVSMSNYPVAKLRNLPFVAIPVFPHRRFRHGFVFINARKGIEKPTDLIGKKVGLRHFQATSNLWVRGILEHEYGVPHKKIHWFRQSRETGEEANLPKDLMLETLPAGKNVETMLVEGELDAVLDPELIKPILDKDPRVKRLFENYKELEVEYYKRTGIFPIMHTTVIKEEIVERYPWVPMSLMEAFNRAKAMAYKRMENPRIVPLAWFRHAMEEQEEIFNKDPWPYGLGEANRKNVAALMQYAYEQGVMEKKVGVDELFVDTR